MHGAQWAEGGERGEPLAYYHRLGPAGDVFRVFRERGEAEDVLAVGLGVGSIAAYRNEGQLFTFVEIDPAVERIARNRRWFSFLEECGDRCEVHIGDGRKLLERMEGRTFGIIFLDAYSSDAIPTHLLTREAMGTYLARLAGKGLLVFHLSNRFLDLEPVVLGLAREAGLYAVRRGDGVSEEEKKASGRLSSHYVVMARREELLEPFLEMQGWKRASPEDAPKPWTDTRSDIMGSLKWK